MKSAIKSYILQILEQNHANSMYRLDIITMVQNRYKGTRCGEVNLAILELVSEYKIEVDYAKLKLTGQYRGNIQHRVPSCN